MAIDNLTEMANRGELGHKVLAEIEAIKSPVERLSYYVAALTYLATNGTKDLGLVRYFNEMSNLTPGEVSESLMDKYVKEYSRLG